MAALSAEVPDELLLRVLVEVVNDGRERLADFSTDDIEVYGEILATAYPLIAAKVRAEVAEMLRDHAAGHRRTAERRGALEHELVRRALTLEAAAAKIARGDGQ